MTMYGGPTRHGAGGNLRTDPYFRPTGTWERKVGIDIYQTPTYCPYCGERRRNEIKAYEGAWTRLRCGACSTDYKVRVRVR